MKKNKIRTINENKVLAVLFFVVIGIFEILNIGTVFESISSYTYAGIGSISQELKTIESMYNSNFFYKNQFINLNGLVSKIEDRRLQNDRILMDNGMLTATNWIIDTSIESANLIEFNKFLVSKEIPYFFTLTPFKLEESDKKLPVGYEDYTNENANVFLDKVESEGVTVFDLRETIREKNIDHYSLFFKTDHHWTAEAAFWATGELADYLNTNYKFGIDKKYLDLENYNIKTYENWFLGSDGKRVGNVYAGIDNISLIYPKFETNMSLEIPAHDITRIGTFEDVIFEYNNIKEKDYFKLNSYAAYIGGDFPLVKIRNEKATCDKKILILKDSYALPVQGFLATAVKEIDVIDLRYYTEYSLEDYIDETNPDVVFSFINPDSVTNDALFLFDN